jgi:GNAT superfamily N-acetyltransferase
VVGFAAGGSLREAGDPLPGQPGELNCSGELGALYVLPGWQGQGIGRALLQASAAWLAAAGHTGMLIWTLAENAPARRFYEAMGGIPARQTRKEFSGVWLEEVGYAFCLPARR